MQNVSFFRDLDDGPALAAPQAARIILILMVAWILQGLAARLIRLFRAYMSRRSAGRRDRRASRPWRGCSATPRRS